MILIFVINRYIFLCSLINNYSFFLLSSFSYIIEDIMYLLLLSYFPFFLYSMSLRNLRFCTVYFVIWFVRLHFIRFCHCLILISLISTRSTRIKPFIMSSLHFGSFTTPAISYRTCYKQQMLHSICNLTTSTYIMVMMPSVHVHPRNLTPISWNVSIWRFTLFVFGMVPFLLTVT